MRIARWRPWMLSLIVLQACFPLYPFRAREAVVVEPDMTPDDPEDPVDPVDPVTPALALAIERAAITVHGNDRITLVVSVTRPAGVDGEIALALSGTPAEISATLPPIAAGATTSTLSVATTTVTSATATMSITATTAGATAASVPLAITLDPIDRFRVSTASLRVVRGGSASFTAEITRDASFAGAVTLTITGATSELTGATTATLQPNETSAMFAFVTSGPAVPGAVSLQITATHAGASLPVRTIALTLRPPPGSPDPALGTRRDVYTDGAMIPVRALAEPGGTVLLLVSTSTSSEVIRIYRYGESGPPSEVATLDVPADHVLARDLKLDAQGRMLVLGVTDQPTGARAIYLARLLPNGTLDPAFGSGGSILKTELFLNPPTSDSPTDIWPCTASGVFVRGALTIVVGKGVTPGYGCEDPSGTRTYAFAVDASGDVVATYSSGTGYFAGHPEAQAFNETIFETAENAAGEVLIVGDTFHPVDSTKAHAYRFDALVPPTFAANAYANITVQTDPSDGTDRFLSVAAAPSGAWYAVGFASRATEWGVSHALAAHVDGTGALTSAHYAPYADAIQTELTSVVVGASGRAFVAGTGLDAQNQWHVFAAQLATNATLDPGFATAGVAIVAHGLGDALYARAAIDTQQRLWVFAGIASASELVAARYFTE